MDWRVETSIYFNINFHMPFNMLSSNNKQEIRGNMKVIRFAQTPKHTLFLIVQK